MARPYQKWMHSWETRLANRDNNRVVRPLDWGLDWTQSWPCRNGADLNDGDPGNIVTALNQQILTNSDRFFAYETPANFRLEEAVKPFTTNRTTVHQGTGNIAVGPQNLRFSSAVRTPFAENNQVVARWFPERHSSRTAYAAKKAVVVLPQWNADAESHLGLCRLFSFLGIAALRLSLPYHDFRKPPEIERADYAVSANVGRTIDAARQAVIDTRSCLDWLQSQGYEQLGIVGTSLGSCYAFIAAAHDPRLRVCAFNHASTYFADVVWAGQSTRHIRAGIENDIDLERLRRAWLVISPMAYFDQFERRASSDRGCRQSLIVYATYDLTFPPELSREIIAEFRRRDLQHEIAVLPCGHYSSGEMPYKYLDGFYLSRFLKRAFTKLGEQ